MEFETGHRPSYAQLTLWLDPAESVRAEARAMVSKSPHVDVETTAEGGVLTSISRSLFGGESLFVNTFRASDAGRLQLAPALSGDVRHHALDDGSL